MGLKLRLNLLITLLMLGILAIATHLLIENAKQDIRAEVASTAKLAKRMLDMQILYISSSGGSIVWQDSPFRLKELSNLRHLHIEFFDSRGRLIDTNQSDLKTKIEMPPSWFLNLLKFNEASKIQIRRTIIVGGRPMGEMVITPDASYEISEVWNDTSSLLMLWGIFFVLVNVMVYTAVSVALRPVKHIHQGLSDLSEGKLEVRLPSMGLPEFENISKQFNLMAERLQKARHDNIRLTKKLINTQEEERKNIARNLHDDLSQSITTIQVLASSINGSENIASIHHASQSILTTTQSVRSVLRDIMKSLRLGCLDELGLRPALLDLLSAWHEQNPNVELIVNIQDGLAELPETLAIAVYRTVQEVLTNATRHALAKRVLVSVGASAENLKVHIEDNGVGFDPRETSKGFGLLGIRERIEGLSGHFELNSKVGEGTSVLVRLPLNGEC